MLKLVCKALVLGLLVLLVKVGLILSARPFEDDYMAASAVKQARLYEPGPDRVIFVGGSNLAFGLDSNSLEACTGRQIVNMGLHAALGLEYMLTEAANGARRGDLVVLVPEYEHFCGGDPAGDGTTLLSLLQFNPFAARHLTNVRQWLSIVRAAAVINNRQWIHTLLIKVAHQTFSKSTDLYLASDFNSKGDFVGHLDKPNPSGVTASRLGIFNPRSIELVDRFCSQMAATGVDCLVVYPSISKSYWALNRSTIDQVATQMSRRRVVTRPEDWVYPDSYFFDTSYHLNRTGRQARTEQLCDVLTRFFHIGARSH